MVDNQEPVAYMYQREDGAAILEFYGDLDFKGMKVKPLYTHPAPAWQGLSLNEINAGRDKIENDEDIILDDAFVYGAQWAEQALKEKNYGN